MCVIFFTDSLKAATQTIKGEVEVNTQNHFAMELFVARAAPIEDGFDVVVTTQHVSESQSVISAVLGIPANR